MATKTAIGAAAMRAARNWHGAWLAAFGVCAVVWSAASGDEGVSVALACAAAPGVVGLILPWTNGWAAKALTAIAWPLGIGAALWLTGGIAGPLGALALAPATAAATLDDRRLIAVSAALTAAMVAAIALASAVGLAPLLAAGGLWLSLIALTAAGVGLAAALLMNRARSEEREALKSDEAGRLKTLLGASPELLLRLDAEGVAREVFSGAQDGAAQGYVGRPFESLACDAHRDAARAAVALARRTGAASVGFAPPLAPDRWLAVDLSALPGGEALALVRDASHERAYEAFLEQARQDAEGHAAAKSRFLANMSHELRTPLNAIIGFSDIMRTQLFGPISVRYAEYAALIHESGGHLLDLINDVLDISKIEADRFTLSREPFDARESVAAALRLTRVQADTARITLRGALPVEPLEVDGDRRAIKQIVLNLISNALKFTPSGGQVNVVARAQGGDLELIVADTGVGIAPGDLERLGRPYEQAGGADQRALGTGLGLSLVRAFAELHGGEMSIKSVLGEGTVVTVRLPVMLGADGFAEPNSPTERKSAALGDNVIAFNPQR
ncbi:MAG: sensor histidine kinase [Caulobacterales bacterium]